MKGETTIAERITARLNHLERVRQFYSHRFPSMNRGWTDGLIQKYHLSRINGRCSLQASLDYDIAKAEESIVEDIIKFQVLATVHAIPVDPVLM